MEDILCITKVGKYTYTDTTHGKNYNAVEQLIHDLKGMGKTVTMDSGFPALKLLKDAKEEWNIAIVATLRGHVAHLPSEHGLFKSRCKSFVRGYSQALLQWRYYAHILE